MENNPITLKEIANRVGVSITTVSRVLNQSNTKVARKEIQDKIWEIVRETNYVPNNAARNLKKKDLNENLPSKTIGIIYARSSSVNSDPFFSEIARSIEKEAFQLGYILKYSLVALDINNPSTYKIVTTNKVDGVAVLGRFDRELLKFLKKHYKNVVYTGLARIEGIDYDQVYSDGYHAAKIVINYLHQLGHTKIGYLGEVNNEVRYQGYCDAMKSLKIPYSQKNIIESPLSSEGGYNAVKKYLEKGKDVTALFCGNDLTAIGAIKGIKESGYSIPGDLSVIGIDDIDTAQYVSPMLTTVHVPLEELGKVAAKTLIDRIQDGRSLPLKVELPISLVKRESCEQINDNTK